MLRDLARRFARLGKDHPSGSALALGRAASVSPVAVKVRLPAAPARTTPPASVPAASVDETPAPPTVSSTSSASVTSEAAIREPAPTKPAKGRDATPERRERGTIERLVVGRFPAIRGRSLEVAITRGHRVQLHLSMVDDAGREAAWFFVAIEQLDEMIEVLLRVRGLVVAERGAGSTWASSAPWGTWHPKSKKKTQPATAGAERGPTHAKDEP